MNTTTKDLLKNDQSTKESLEVSHDFRVAFKAGWGPREYCLKDLFKHPETIFYSEVPVFVKVKMGCEPRLCGGKSRPYDAEKYPAVLEEQLYPNGDPPILKLNRIWMVEDEITMHVMNAELCLYFEIPLAKNFKTGEYNRIWYNSRYKFDGTRQGGGLVGTEYIHEDLRYGDMVLYPEEDRGDSDFMIAHPSTEGCSGPIVERELWTWPGEVSKTMIKEIIIKNRQILLEKEYAVAIAGESLNLRQVNTFNKFSKLEVLENKIGGIEKINTTFRGNWKSPFV